MALIKCPECKKKISDQCDNCPHCGYPVKTNLKETAQAEEKIETDNIVENKEEIVKAKLPKERKPINKKKLAIISSTVVVVLIVGSIVGYNLLLPRINATKGYNKVVEKVELKNKELEKAIKKSEKLIDKKQPLLDETLISALETAISDAKAVKVTDLDIPHSINDIISKTSELKGVDYTEALNNLKDKHNALEINAKRYQLVNKPTEAYVIQCLKTIPEIVNISAVTEDNDPNGNLNKAGGYTATVYFAHQNIQLDKSIYGETLIEQGTDAGGGVEVYTCVEDAEKRRDYLASFDGSIFASGTHTVIGTVLVRTSDELTASQQKELEAKVIEALIYLPEVDDKQDTQNEQTQSVSQTPDAQASTQETNQPADTSENQKVIESAEEITNTYVPTNKTPSTSSPVGSYTHISTGDECTFSLYIYEDGTFMWSNDDVPGLTASGTWTQSGSSVTFEEYSIAGDETFYYKNTYTLNSDGIQYGDWYYIKN